MPKFKPDVYLFNNNKSRTILHFSDINLAWIVYREDGIQTNSPIQGNVRVHNSFSDAKADYKGRVDFIKKMQEDLKGGV
jgi:quinolinate synthase|tara:strand:+ start:2065 stop:2301 length:237 start_codon:yes stop_codon:yes gene_type:complete